MPSATLTSKGQLTVPIQVRNAMGVEAGDRIEFVEIEKGHFEIMAATRSLKELNGLFKGRRQKPATIEEMDEAIARSVIRSR